MWIQREISKKISQNKDPVQIIRGPRQCGKSSLILHLDQEFKEISLDDFSLRDLAQSDPELFLKQFGEKKLFIDEAQYAPELFPAIKRRVDLLKRRANKSFETQFRLSGSNQILMDKNVKESLAGRASFFEMNTLSIGEILSARDISIQQILYLGGWPEIHANDLKDSKKYLDDYISSYVEKDIVLTAGIQKSAEFLKFIKLLAGRVGQILEFASLARDVGVDPKAIKDWVSILEKMQIVKLVEPFSTNLSKRLIKSPKVYFIDTGLACRLQGWTSPEPILTSPQQGQLFENLVFSEIYKLRINYNIDFQVFHWRSRAGEEIDFLLQLNPKDFLFIEAKSSRPNSKIEISKYAEVKKVFKSKVPELIICHQEGNQKLGQSVPIIKLSEYLRAEIGY